MILEKLGCHHIRKHGTEYRAALPDGDNSSAIRILRDTLSVKVFTRGDFPEIADIITLVEYIKNIYFTQAMYWICEICKYDYYKSAYIPPIEQDPLLTCLDQIAPTQIANIDEQLEKIDEVVLRQFVDVPNLWFLRDGITYETQKEYEIKFSTELGRIIIPVRDDFGNLVGVKGRTIYEESVRKGLKYTCPISYPKTKVLYGLYKSLPFIKEAGEVIVYEAEKGHLQSWSMGVKNCVGAGGHELSPFQVMMLERLNVDVVLAFDKGLTRDNIRKERDKFMIKGRLYCIWDNKDILANKESPVDKGLKTWQKLYNECKFLIK